MSWGTELFELPNKSETIHAIQSLLRSGTNINSKSHVGYTLLALAAKYEDEDTVKYLVAKGAKLKTAQLNGDTPLHVAAINGYASMVKLFLEFGMFVDIRNNTNKCTALHHAAGNGHLETVKILLDNKACIDATDAEGHTPLSLAVMHSEYDPARDRGTSTPILLEPYDRYGQHSTVDVIRLLVSSGAKVNCRKGDLWSPLHYAVYLGLYDVVELFLKNGAEVNRKSCYGTPLEMCVRFPQKEDIATLLVNAGANVNFRDGDTALHYASANGWLGMVKLLLKKAPDPHVKDRCHSQPLHCACDSKLLMIAEELISENKSKLIKVFEHLLTAGADCNARNKNGTSAFNFIVKNLPNVEVIKMFIEHGAYVTPGDYNKLSEKHFLREGILKNVGLCTQAIMNKFNNQELPELYEISDVKKHLPQIENLKIIKNSQMAESIKKSVEYQIETNEYCNLLEVRLLLLNVMAVKRLIAYYKDMHKLCNIKIGEKKYCCCPIL